MLISPDNQKSLLSAAFAVLISINVGIFKDIAIDISDELRESSLISVVCADVARASAHKLFIASVKSHVSSLAAGCA